MSLSDEALIPRCNGLSEVLCDLSKDASHNISRGASDLILAVLERSAYYTVSSRPVITLSEIISRSGKYTLSIRFI